MHEKTCELVENKIFVEKTFVDFSLVPPKDATPPNFAEKHFQIATKPRNFSPPKVSRFTVFTHACIVKKAVALKLSFLQSCKTKSRMTSLDLRMAKL